MLLTVVCIDLICPAPFFDAIICSLVQRICTDLYFEDFEGSSRAFCFKLDSDLFHERNAGDGPVPADNYKSFYPSL